LTLSPSAAISRWGRFNEVFFIDASTETIIEDLKSISTAKQVGDAAGDTLLYLSHLQSEWLLFFNNADDTSINIRNYFPICSHGNILITTRNANILGHLYNSDTEKAIPVGGMSTNDAKNLLVAIANLNPETIDMVEVDEVVKVSPIWQLEVQKVRHLTLYPRILAALPLV
jgi:hypothetical protein